MINWNSSKLKKLPAKPLLRRFKKKKQATGWEKIFASHRELIFRIYTRAYKNEQYKGI